MCLTNGERLCPSQIAGLSPHQSHSTAHPHDDRLLNILNPRVGSDSVNGKEKLSSEFHNPVDMPMGAAYAGDG